MQYIPPNEKNDIILNFGEFGFRNNLLSAKCDFVLITEISICLVRCNRFIVERIDFVSASTIFTISDQFCIFIATKSDHCSSSRSIPKQLHSHGAEIQDSNAKGNYFEILLFLPSEKMFTITNQILTFSLVLIISNKK